MSSSSCFEEPSYSGSERSPRPSKVPSSSRGASSARAAAEKAIRRRTERIRTKRFLAPFIAEFAPPVAVSHDMRLITVLAALALTGCAGSGSSDCGPDWRSVGQRDGRMNAGSQAANYAARCGTPVDGAAYEEGYRAGFAQRPPPNW